MSGSRGDRGGPRRPGRIGGALPLLAIAAGCWSGRPAAGHPRAAAPAPRPHLPAPLAAVIGVFDDAGALEPAVEIPLVGGTSFGWRLHLDCADGVPVRVREELRLPAPGDWGADPSLDISADQRTAVVVGDIPCAQGWIERSWLLSPGDPPGPWDIRVTARGFARHVFRLTVARPPP